MKPRIIVFSLPENESFISSLNRQTKPNQRLKIGPYVFFHVSHGCSSPTATSPLDAAKSCTPDL